jgi:ABC-type glycerol-3-phosphate transport system permease component
METVANILKWVASLVLAIVAPIIIIVIGAMMVGYGIYRYWQWLRNAGVVLAAFGFIWIMKEWVSD